MCWAPHSLKDVHGNQRRSKVLGQPWEGPVGMNAEVLWNGNSRCLQHHIREHLCWDKESTCCGTRHLLRKRHASAILSSLLGGCPSAPSRSLQTSCSRRGERRLPKAPTGPRILFVFQMRSGASSFLQPAQQDFFLLQYWPNQ